MKKIGILLGILLIAGVCAMADEAATLQDDLLFADVEAVALSQVEMSEFVGGQYPGDYGETVKGTKAAIRIRRKDATRYESEMALYGTATDGANNIPGGWRISGGPNGTESRYWKAAEKKNIAEEDCRRLGRKLGR